jgi:hypothetical protein
VVPGSNMDQSVVDANRLPTPIAGGDSRDASAGGLAI